MKILSIETSTEACSAALWVDGEGREIFQLASNRHSSLLLPQIYRLLDQAGLNLSQCDAVAFGQGPGSFTGLRIGVGIAQGLAFGADLPVIPVSTLHAQAMRCAGSNILAAIDARMGQVYWGVYARVGMESWIEPTEPVRLSQPENVTLSAGEWCASGTGCDRYLSTLVAHNPAAKITLVAHSYPHALDVARIALRLYGRGETQPAEQAAPHYVRNQVAG